MSGILYNADSIVEKIVFRVGQVFEYAGGVVTVSNLGMLGVDAFRALVNPGESAIVACGTITDTVVVTGDGEFVARPVMKVTGAFDHRTVDGAAGARVLARVKELLEAPELLGAPEGLV